MNYELQITHYQLQIDYKLHITNYKLITHYQLQIDYKLHITNYKLDEGVCVEGHRLVQKALRYEP